MLENHRQARPETADSSPTICDLLFALPHGVAAMSTDMHGLVETSNNLANVKIASSKLEIVTSQRSSVMSRLHALTSRIEIHRPPGRRRRRQRQRLPVLAAQHAVAAAGPLQGGLPQSCSARNRTWKPFTPAWNAASSATRKPGMDMISFGPTLKNPHSPDEKIHVESIGKVWDFLVELLKSLK